jgi:hypothetical protein
MESIMTLNKIALGLSLVSLFAIAGCGSEAANDPLAGAWSNDTCFGAASKPADIESCSTKLTFSDGLKIDLDAQWVSLAATAKTPGCTTTRLVTGQEWSADHAKNTFNVSGSGASTIERTTCVNDTDNLNATSTTDISIPSGDSTYALSGDTLTIKTGALKGAYNRNILP